MADCPGEVAQEQRPQTDPRAGCIRCLEKARPRPSDLAQKGAGQRPVMAIASRRVL